MSTAPASTPEPLLPLEQHAEEPPTPPAEAPAAPHGPRLRRTVAVALLTAAFAADYLTGSEVSSSLYYIVAIAYATWFVGRRAGVVTAVAGATAWLAAYHLVGDHFGSTRVLVWNLLAEFSIYLAIAVGLGSLHDSFLKTQSLAGRLFASNQALDREARAVGSLQRRLLPEAPPLLAGYAWSIHYETSTQAGGDYYDFIPFADGRIGILIADASGHGTPAAVLMGMTRTLLHVDGEDAPTPDETLLRMAQDMRRLLPAGWFVTACYAILDPASGTFDYSLAGHDAPFVARARTGRLERLPTAGGPPLGFFTEMGYEAERFQLEPGDTLILYTDGLTEAQDANSNLLGEDAVRDAIVSPPDFDPNAIRTRLLVRVAEHRAGAPASDDLTLLILGRKE